MTGNSFFEESSDQSRVKTVIVSKYFYTWAQVIISAQKCHPDRSSDRIAYIDLFAGPGRYKDGTKSTPLHVLEKAIQNQDLCQRLITIFNDKDENSSHSLKAAIDELQGVKSMAYAPKVCSYEVGTEIVEQFEKMRLVPTLFFVDPWGYKGLSLQLVNSILKDWGCDCIFFFNYNRINMGLGNPAVRQHMDALFGEKRADQLRRRLEPLSPNMREVEIVEELCQALKDLGGRYVLPFNFKNDRGNRTSHHLIFVSKNFKGYEIMKGIMARESSKAVQGVPSFEYSPATKRQPLLFELSRPLEELEDILLKEFAGQTLLMHKVYERHNVGRRYIKKNYKDTLINLEIDGKIETEPPAGDRRRNTLGDNVRVSFPPKKD